MAELPSGRMGQDELVDPVAELDLAHLVGQHVVVDVELPAQVFSARVLKKCFEFVHVPGEFAVVSEEALGKQF